MMIYVAISQGLLFIFFIIFHILLPVLRNEHNYEFKQHLKQFLLQSVTFLVAIIIEAVLLFLLYWYVLFNFNQPPPTSAAFLGQSQNDSCSDNKVKGCNHNLTFLPKSAAFWLFMALLNIAELLPFFVFLLKNTLYPPHDCFTCFNKDPDRRYSIYQYSKQEWQQILFEQRPKASRMREARALTEMLDSNDHVDVPTEAGTTNLLQKKVASDKTDRLVEEMVKDHRMLNKFHNMFSMKDVERLGGEMSGSVALVSETNVQFVHDDVDMMTASYLGTETDLKGSALSNKSL
jgi:hypothetical protein